MKVQIPFEKFKKEISRGINACMKIGQNQQLKGIFLDAADNTLTIRATNIDIGFESTINCKVETEGKFLIAGDVLGRLLGNINSKNTSICFIEVSENLCTINIETHSFKLKTLNFENFPNLPKVTGVDISVDSKVFLGGLRSVLYSVAKSEIKPEISGVYIKFEKNNIFFVATDAYRLTEKKATVEEEHADIGLIIPEKNVKDILRILENEESGKIRLTISKNSLELKKDNTYLVSRLVDGVFPNYNQIVPTNPVSYAIFLKDDLVKSLKIVSFFSDKTQQINLNIESANTKIEASNSDVGSTTETLDSTLKGESFSVKLNSRYLEEFLQNTNDQSVVLKYTAQNKAIIVQGIQDNSYTYLIMPSYR